VLFYQNLVKKGNRLSILVVDDDPGIRETMADILGEMNFLVYTASDGLEALDLIDKYSIDLVLMDMRMPGLDGVETSKRIKSIHPKMRIIMITAYASPEVFDMARNAGIQEIMNKPINFQQLANILA